MKNSVVQMNANAGSLKHDYSEIDKYFQTYSPQELTKDFHRLHAGLASILAQVVECTYEYGEYHFLIRDEATEGIYRLLDFFEHINQLNK